MYKVNNGAIGSGVYYWVVLINEGVETPSGLGLFTTYGEAQDAANRLREASQ